SSRAEGPAFAHTARRAGRRLRRPPRFARRSLRRALRGASRRACAVRRASGKMDCLASAADRTRSAGRLAGGEGNPRRRLHGNERSLRHERWEVRQCDAREGERTMSTTTVLQQSILREYAASVALNADAHYYGGARLRPVVPLD